MSTDSQDARTNVRNAPPLSAPTIKSPDTASPMRNEEKDNETLLKTHADSLDKMSRMKYLLKLDALPGFRAKEIDRLRAEARAIKEAELAEEARIAEEARVAHECEQARLRQIERERQIEEESINEINELSDQVPHLTVAFIGVKGSAGTTTTTVHVASMAANIMRCMLIAGDFNPASGTCADRLGKGDGRTTDIRGFLAELDTLDNFRKVIGKIRPTEYGVRVLSANDIVSNKEHLTGEDTEKMLDVIQENSEYVYLDTANDITDEVSLAVVAKSDVLVFTANVGVQDSLRRLATGMETLRQHDFVDKVNNSVVVISNMPLGDDIREYRKYLNRVDIENKVVKDYVFDGSFMQVPHDPVISRDTIVDLEALEWRTAQAYRTLVIEIFKQAPQFRATPTANPAVAIQTTRPAQY